ncbi:hypothetical protein ACM66B_006533 [Microbotryomycetes sp. NB124-2]
MSLADFQFEAFGPSSCVSAGRARTLSAQFRHDWEQQQQQQPPQPSSSSSPSSSMAWPAMLRTVSSSFTSSNGVRPEDGFNPAHHLSHPSTAAQDSDMSFAFKAPLDEFGSLVPSHSMINGEQVQQQQQQPHPSYSTPHHHTYRHASHQNMQFTLHSSSSSPPLASQQQDFDRYSLHDSPTSNHHSSSQCYSHHAMHPQHQQQLEHHHTSHQQHFHQQPDAPSVNPGLGLDMQVEHGIGDRDDETVVAMTSAAAPSDHVSAMGAEMARQRPPIARHRHTKSQSSMHHPYSGTSSPAPSRSGSIRGLASLHITTPNSPGIVQFPTLMSPSPFRQPTTPTAATMDPSQSVLSRSPSSTSSVSGDFGPANMSRVGSSSAASSVFGGDSNDPTGSGATGLYRSPSTLTTASRSARPSLSRRLSSPAKSSRVSKKLTDLDRKAICLFRESNPTVKQDDIGVHFGIERSTVSKILKNKLKWLAIPGQVSVDRSPSSTTPSGSLSIAHEATASASEAQQSPTTESVSQASDQGKHDDAAGDDGTGSTMPPVSGGRYPQLDNELAAWARSQAQFGSLDDGTLTSKAKDIASLIPGCDGFKASNSWLDGFKARAGIENGAFVDTRTSPTTIDKLELIVEDEQDAAASTADEQGGEGGDTGEFVGRSSRRLRRHMLGSSNRSSSRPSTASAPTPKSSTDVSAHSVGAQDMDARATLGRASRFAFDSEATPTHSTTHSRATSGTTEQRMFDALYSYDLTTDHSSAGATTANAHPATIMRPATVPAALMDGGSTVRMQATPSRRPSVHTLLTPLSIENVSPATGTSTDVLTYVANDTNTITTPHSLYAAGNAYSPFSQYAQQQASGSGSHSPATSFQHGRSGSIASTTSSYSGLTAFSSQTGLGTPLTGSMYGSFPTSHSQPNSVPSTPGYGLTVNNGTGYFGHGDGTQSQLQAAFVPSRKPSSSQNNSPLPMYGMPAQPARRATISGGSPFGGSSGIASNPLSTMQAPSAAPNAALTVSPTKPAVPAVPAGAAAAAAATSVGLPNKTRKPVVTLDQARASLEVAFDYLKSAEAQGFAEPKDLLVIWELKEKMSAAAANKKSGSNASGQSSSTTVAPTGKFTLTGTSRRIRLGRTQSASSISSLTSLTGLTSSLGLGSKRNSLLDSSMDVTEEPR